MWILVALLGAVNGDNTNELFEWVRGLGGFIDSRVELSTGPDPSWTVRGLFATEPLAADEVVVRLPPESLICHETACGLIGVMRDELMKGEKSRYWPYLKSMETHEIDYPNVWTAEERSLLGGLQPTDWDRHTYWFREACWPEMWDSPGEKPDEQAWRALHLYVARITGVQTQLCFVPIYDSMNHRNGDDLNTVWTDHSSHVQIATKGRVDKGTQLWNSFGEGAGRMLRDYGFLEQNPTEWTVEVDGHVCSWELEKSGEVRWLSSPSGCLQSLEGHLAALPAPPAPSASMKPGRVQVAQAYRKNYIQAVQAAIQSLSRGEL